MIGLQYETGEVSLLGNRSTNQDRCAILHDPNAVLLALADGMGGHPKGEVAAQILVDTCESQFLKVRKPITEPRLFISRLLHDAHENIVAYGYGQTPTIEPRTTAVVALIQEGTAYWVHIGDSRLYLFRKGRVFTRTKDHSYVEQLHRQGLISAEDRKKHPQRNFVTRCLGGMMNPPEVSHGTPTQLQAEDVLLLCSDGLWGKINSAKLATAVSGKQKLSKLIPEIAKRAYQIAYPESDNVTAVALRCRSVEIKQATQPFSQPEPTQISQQQAPVNLDQQLQDVIKELQQALNDFERNL